GILHLQLLPRSRAEVPGGGADPEEADAQQLAALRFLRVLEGGGEQGTRPRPEPEQRLRQPQQARVQLRTPEPRAAAPVQTAGELRGALAGDVERRVLRAVRAALGAH